MTVPIPARSSRQPNDDRCVVATSISQRVYALVIEPRTNLNVESVFADACNIVAPDGQRYSLVSNAIGDGPLNVVLSRSEFCSVIEIGDPVSSDGHALMIGRGWRIAVDQARPWNPVPRWDRLANWPHIVRSNIAWLDHNISPRSPLLEVTGQESAILAGAFGSRPSNAVIQGRASQAIRALVAAYQSGDVYRIKTAARRLAGLGPGLTPAGDDWLAGWLVGLRVRFAIDLDADQSHLPVETVGKAVLQGASGRTTELSLAFMAAAADGALSQAWHALIDALSNADPVPLYGAAERVMQVGATSGSDMLAGFLAAFEAKQ